MSLLVLLPETATHHEPWEGQKIQENLLIQRFLKLSLTVKGSEP